MWGLILSVVMTAPGRTGGSKAASRTLFGGAGALLRGSGGGGGRGSRCAPFIAAIGAHSSVMDFAVAAVGFAAVATLTQQLNIRGFVTTSAGKWDDVVVLQVVGNTAALADASVPGVDYFLCRLRYIATLGKTQYGSKEECYKEEYLFHRAS